MMSQLIEMLFFEIPIRNKPYEGRNEIIALKIFDF